jgi:hypothetical protein
MHQVLNNDEDPLSIAELLRRAVSHKFYEPCSEVYRYTSTESTDAYLYRPYGTETEE